VPAVCRVYISKRYELLGRHRRKHPPHADLEKVGILAVIVCPLPNELFVRNRARAGVYLARVPPVFEFAGKALFEAARVPRGVSEYDQIISVPWPVIAPSYFSRIGSGIALA